MATYQSISNSAWQVSSSSVVNKPSGLSVGDIMLAYSASSAASITFPSGFTSIGETSAGANNYKTYLGYKVATSGDVSASNFTFTMGSSSTNICVLIRIKDASIATSTIQSSGALISNTATPSLSGITPYSRGNNLIFQLWHGSDAVASVSSYAIATSNPSWTEVLDISNGDPGVGIAYATRPEVTATGNFSCSGGNANTDWGGWIISFTPKQIVSLTETISHTETYLKKISIFKNEQISHEDIIDTDKSRIWTEEAKNSNTWTEENK